MPIGSVKITELPSNDGIKSSDLFLISKKEVDANAVPPYKSYAVTYNYLSSECENAIFSQQHRIISGEWTFLKTPLAKTPEITANPNSVVNIDYVDSLFAECKSRCDARFQEVWAAINVLSAKIDAIQDWITEYENREVFFTITSGLDVLNHNSPQLQGDENPNYSVSRSYTLTNSKEFLISAVIDASVNHHNHNYVAHKIKFPDAKKVHPHNSGYSDGTGDTIYEIGANGTSVTSQTVTFDVIMRPGAKCIKYYSFVYWSETNDDDHMYISSKAKSLTYKVSNKKQ